MGTPLTDSNFKQVCYDWSNDINKSSIITTHGDISVWDTSQVTDMSQAFKDAVNFNDDISKWDTSKVTDMGFMFNNCEKFNQNINTKEVTKEDGSTYLAWDTGLVTNMYEMIAYCNVFNGNISEWNTSEVTNMESMFYDCYAFNQDLSNWERKVGVNSATSTSTLKNVTNMYGMFSYSKMNQNLSGWILNSSVDVNNMFNLSGNTFHEVDSVGTPTILTPINRFKILTSALTNFTDFDLSRPVYKINVNGEFKNILEVVTGDIIKDINGNDITATVVSKDLKEEIILLKNTLSNYFKKKLVKISINDKLNFVVEKFFIRDYLGDYIELSSALLEEKSFVGTDVLANFKSLEKSVINLKNKYKYMGNESNILVNDNSICENKVNYETLKITLAY